MRKRIGGRADRAGCGHRACARMRSHAPPLVLALMLAAACVQPAAAMPAAPLDAAPAGAARQYRNPILFADYSDPDVIRVGDQYVMTASTFHFSPGLPVLTSKDLVHWRIVAHALPRLPFGPAYDLPGPLDFDEASARARLDPAMGHRYSAGVWAPAIRHHGGRYYIYFATPTDGIFMVSAERPEGPWTAPVALVAQAGLEDPCPFWDDDGSAWLIHSRVGAGPLILRQMTPDATRVLDEGTVVMEDPVNLPVLEGPKLLKRNGWYYIFAPYGGGKSWRAGCRLPPGDCMPAARIGGSGPRAARIFPAPERWQGRRPRLWRRRCARRGCVRGAPRATLLPRP